MTHDQPTVRAVARLLSERVVVICTTCGAPDTRDTSGRRRHQQLYGHVLSGCETDRPGEVRS